MNAYCSVAENYCILSGETEPGFRAVRKSELLRRGGANRGMYR